MKCFNRKILVDLDSFTVNFKMTKSNSQTKMTKSISQKMTISNSEGVFLSGGENNSR